MTAAILGVFNLSQFTVLQCKLYHPPTVVIGNKCNSSIYLSIFLQQCLEEFSLDSKNCVGGRVKQTFLQGCSCDQNWSSPAAACKIKRIRKVDYGSSVSHLFFNLSIVRVLQSLFYFSVFSPAFFLECRFIPSLSSLFRHTVLCLPQSLQKP